MGWLDVHIIETTESAGGRFKQTAEAFNARRMVSQCWLDHLLYVLSLSRPSSQGSTY